MTAQPIAKPVAYSRDLTTVFAEVLPHAARYDDLPLIHALHFHASGGQLTVEATDRYSAGRTTIGWQGADIPESLLDLDHCNELLRILKGRAGRGPGEPLKVTCGEEDITFTVPGLTVTYPLMKGGFPKITKLLDDKAQDGGPEVGLNADYLARFRAARRSSREPIRVTLGKPTKILVGTHFRGLLMPVRPSE